MFNSERYKPTYVLICLNLAMYIYTSIVGGDFFKTNIDVIAQYGQVNFLVLDYGWYYQLVTSLFVHVTLVHLAGNMLFLLIFGLRAEEMFSLPEYLIVYLLGGLAGNLLTLAFMAPNVPSAGASGAIFALFGACVIYDRRSIGQSIMGALIYAGFLLLISSGPEVNYFAHFGGMISGLLIGYIIAATRKGDGAARSNYSYRRNPMLFFYGLDSTSILTLLPSFRLSCFRRQTGAMISKTEMS
jgi:rhomboid protease GluP